MSVNFNITKERQGNAICISFLFVLLFFVPTPFSYGQEHKNMDKVVIGDNRFILHKVERNQTLYSISKIYDCSQEEILAANKTITGVIKKGMVLKIPDHTYQKPQAVKIDESKFTRYQIISGDNYYQLNLKYGVVEEELLKLNPELKDGLKAGQIILIPLKSRTKSETETISKEASKMEPPAKESPTPFRAKGADQNFNVGLYLPISATVADSLKPTAKSLSFLSFYQGALMAVDQLAKIGIKVKLFVYDTEKSSSNIGILVKKPEFLSLDLLIGPVYPENQKVISELCAKNRIPMVSPLSPDDKYAKMNPWYFQVNPAKKMRMEATTDYIVKEFPREKVIFLESDNGGSETRQMREYLNKKRGAPETTKGLTSSYNIWSKGTGELESQLKSDQSNILVMADINEVNVSIAMNRLALISKKYPLILIGIQEFTRMQSIEIENLHSVNLRYLSTYFVNYNLPAVTAFVENFKVEFGTEPSLFAFQGYDMTTFFLKSLQKKERFSRSSPTGRDSDLLHTYYHFTKISDFGGYTNDSFTVVEYSNSYEVKALEIIRHGE
ncbi:MAG: ABC transporter substrate-binding protein [Prolixibacteraceae bacterium]|jgi:ABC-type branched-subunit amino acid transport system substrate-binding protein/LysM repeat protein|nr:ABC transporter substrate-binding protein [Prolixibacteraceae bacterium]